jgi:hypothetical protein
MKHLRYGVPDEQVAATVMADLTNSENRSAPIASRFHKSRPAFFAFYRVYWKSVMLKYLKDHGNRG